MRDVKLAFFCEIGTQVGETRFALRFIVHLVGDLQQPLHVGDNHDRGGNHTQIRFFDKG